MIAIHDKKEGFSRDWIRFCTINRIPYKRVNCYNSNIIKQLEECDALMWHFHHANPKDVVFAKQLLYALQCSGKITFPDFQTSWHFDDKLGQKYLMEAIKAPFVPSYVFYDEREALEWVKGAEFPKVLKLRRGSGSSHVRFVKDQITAKKLIKKSFTNGFSQYDPVPNLIERYRKYRSGSVGFNNILKGVARFVYTTEFNKVAGKEKGYVYFQDYIPGNTFDIRVVVIDNKAFAIKRMVRKNDFRASGSGIIKYEKSNFDTETVRLSFKIAERLNTQVVALDYIYENRDPKVIEISYGYSKEVYNLCPGYWNQYLDWIEEPFNPQYWMVQSILKMIQKRKKQAIHSGTNTMVLPNM